LAEVATAVAPRTAVRESAWADNHTSALEPYSQAAEVAPLEVAAQTDPDGELERRLEPEVAEVGPAETAAPTAPHDEHERRAPDPTQVAAEAPPPLTASRAGSATDRVDSSQAEELSAPKDWTCKISVWRGYRKAAFYAGSYYDGEEVAIAESKMFRAGGNGIPDRNTQSEKAYGALCEQLERDGWKRASRGDTWFGDTFRRELTVSEGPAPE